MRNFVAADRLDALPPDVAANVLLLLESATAALRQQAALALERTPAAS